MSMTRKSLSVFVFAGAACLALAPVASAATSYQITAVPPIGTIYSDTVTTLAVVVAPSPVGAAGSTPVVIDITEPDGDRRTLTAALTLGGATVATSVHEAGRYVAVLTFAPPVGDPATTTMAFDVLESPFGTGSAS